MSAGTSTLTVTDTETITTFLDTSGSGALDAFDPALGTLTSVAVTVDTSVLVQNCIENLSAEAGSTVGGPVTANLTATFPTGLNSTVAAIDTAIPATDLPASNGADNCAPGPDPTTGHYNAPISASDTFFNELTDTGSTSQTYTAAADMSPFVGPGTVAFGFTSASNADITQPSEWDIVFVAQGTLTVTVVYTYTSAPCIPPTTTVPGGPTLTTAPGTVYCVPPCVPPTTTIAGVAPPTTAIGAVPCAPPPCVPVTTTIAGVAPPTTAVGAVPCAPPCLAPTTTVAGADPGGPMVTLPGQQICALPRTGGSPGGVTAIAAVSLLIGLGALIVGMRGRPHIR